MTTVDAAVLRGPRDLSIESLKLEDPRSDEVLVDVRATGVCHSDHRRYAGEADPPLPIVLGHEGAGVVEAVGEDVSALEPGDHVVLTATPSCGECPGCESGKPYHCEGNGHAFRGVLSDGTRRLSDADGEPVNHFFAQASFATQTVVPARTAVPVREDAPLETVSLLACGAKTGIGAVLNTAEVDPGDSVAVFGCGGLGSSAIMAAAAVSASEIVAVDLVEEKLERSREFGATATVNAGEADPVASIEELTGGVDHAFEFTGNTDVMRQAFDAIDRGGQAVVSGMAGRDADVSLPAGDLVQDKCIRGNLGGSTNPRVDIPRYVDMYMRGDVDLDALRTRTYPLAELEAAFEAIENDEVIRSVVTFD